MQIYKICSYKILKINTTKQNLGMPKIYIYLLWYVMT